MSPQRIQQRRTKGWRKPDGAVAVGRGTKWGNPWRAWRGHCIGPAWFDHKALPMDARVLTAPLADCRVFTTHSSAAAAVEEAVDTFRGYCNVMARDHRHEFAAWIAPLRGRDLMCWCPLDQPCHADVLLELANTTTEGTNR